MKVQVDRNQLQRKLELVGRCIKANVSHPVLRGVQVSANRQKLQLLTTNLEVVAKAFSRVERIEEEGEIVVSFEYLLIIISKLNEGLCELQTKENKLIVKQGKINFEILLLNKKEFPSFPEVKWIEIGTVKEEIFKKVSFVARDAVSSGTTLIYSLYFDGNKVVATDARRLIIVRSQKLEKKFVLPFNTIEILKESAEKFQVYLSENKVKFVSESFQLISNMLDGEYPNYKTLIPKNEKFVEVDRINLKNLLDRAVIAGTNSIVFNIESDKLKVKNRSNVVIYKEELKSNFTGKKLDIRFNPKFLVEVLEILNEKKVRLEVKDSESPVVIREKDVIYTFVPMEL